MGEPLAVRLRRIAGLCPSGMHMGSFLGEPLVLPKWEGRFVPQIWSLPFLCDARTTQPMQWGVQGASPLWKGPMSSPAAKRRGVGQISDLSPFLG